MIITPETITPTVRFKATGSPLRPYMLKVDATLEDGTVVTEYVTYVDTGKQIVRYFDSEPAIKTRIEYERPYRWISIMCNDEDFDPDNLNEEIFQIIK